ncbi:MAG: hypothetical protein IJZ85_04120 [Lachnospiraceae bacterium]|nr:hypothetical protein [Lachnospiraceae bacterium]
MKQIYHFEQSVPPVLNENILQRKLRERERQKQTAMAAVGGILLEISILLLSIQLCEVMPLIGLIGLVYVFASVIGGCVITLVVVQKRRVFLK